MSYSHPNALVETAWLADHLDDAKVVPMDASWHLPTVQRDAHAEYRQAHIPGALFFDIDSASAQNTDLPHMLPSPDEFACYVSALGIDNDTHVVVYDSYGLFSAARVWWMFRVFGHNRVSVLNGGLPKWINEKRPLTSEKVVPEQTRFKADFHPEMVQSLDEMKANLADETRQVLDARSQARFLGQAPEPRPGIRAGHIPGSKCLPFDTLIDPKDKTLLPATEIKERLAAVDLHLEHPITCSCGTGVTACVLALGLHLVGHDDVAVYDGSWTEWGVHNDTPIEI